MQNKKTLLKPVNVRFCCSFFVLLSYFLFPIKSEIAYSKEISLFKFISPSVLLLIIIFERKSLNESLFINLHICSAYLFISTTFYKKLKKV